jgi:hypothetical protein
MIRNQTNKEMLFPNAYLSTALLRLLLNKTRLNNYPLFTFKIGFEEAEAFRKSCGCYLRANQWEDISVEVYI